MKTHPNRTLFISRLSMLIALTIVIQIAGLPQPFTGPLINAMLIFTVQILGLPAALILGTITPAAALIRGQLPPVMAPMLPFIALGNGLMSAVFHLVFISGKLPAPVFKIKWYLAIITSSSIKFLWLYFSVIFILPVIFGHELPAPVAAMMALPQFMTALAGGIISGFFVNIFQKKMPAA